jgi:glycolate oxidase
MTKPTPAAPTGQDAAVATLAPRLADICGQDAVITDPMELRTYECDGLTAHRCSPGIVVLPQTAAQIAAIVKECAQARIPFVARGSGTGLSGGALPRADGVLIVTARMRQIIEIDAKAAQPYGLFYAPDPSSQQICSVGGNVAENSGGAHCLKHGFTVHHVTGLEVVTPDGELTWLGDGTGNCPGYDLLGAFTGSEGTLGIVTKIVVKLTPIPQAVTTLLAAFNSTGEGGAAVSAIIGSGILPAAIEMMDALAIEAAEASVKPGYPKGAALLIVELEGEREEVGADAARLDELLRASGATQITSTEDPDERALIWQGRKSAFSAVGWLAPDYIVQDGVVPRTRLSEALARIGRMSAEAGIRVANVFHAGDGNLHPLILFDGSEDGAVVRAEELAADILRLCVELGGSITGEHGVALEKRAFLSLMFSDDDLALMRRLRHAVDPAALANPGKMLEPAPAPA